MTLYARAPRRRAAQILGDVGIVAWIIGWVLVGRAARDLVAALASPVRAAGSAGTQYTEALGRAADSVAGVPVVGARVAEALRGAGVPGQNVVTSANEAVAQIERLATYTGIGIALVPIAVLVVPWIVRRVRFVREAAAAQRLVDQDEGQVLFALQALTRAPVTDLVRVGPDVIGGFERRDPATISALARLELDRLGARPRQPTRS